jgi:hypothetical protein
MKDKIEIKVDARKLTPEKFLAAAESFFAIVQGVAKNVVQQPIQWSVEVQEGSTVIRMRAQNPSDASEKALDAVIRGMHSLRSGNPVIPPGFTKEEIRASKYLAEVINGTDIQSISIKNGAEPEPLSPAIASVADAILSGEHHTAFGSLEGKLDSLSDRHGFSCSIYEPLLRREIVCYFQKDEIKEEAVKGFRKRVLAGGLIRYAKEGHPTSIVVDTIRIFPEESELPTVEEIQEIYKQYK